MLGTISAHLHLYRPRASFDTVCWSCKRLSRVTTAGGERILDTKVQCCVEHEMWINGRKGKKKQKKDASCSDTTIISRARWQIAATYDLLIFNCFSECFVHRLGRSQWCRPAAELSRAGPVLACLSPQVTTLALGWSQREGPEKHDNKQDPHFHTVVWQHRPHNDTARRALDGAVTNVAWMQRSAVSVHSAGWWWWSYGSWAT